VQTRQQKSRIPFYLFGAGTALSRSCTLHLHLTCKQPQAGTCVTAANWRPSQASVSRCWAFGGFDRVSGAGQSPPHLCTLCPPFLGSSPILFSDTPPSTIHHLGDWPEHKRSTFWRSPQPNDMEAAIALGSLKVAYHLIISGIQLDQVPDAVRRCIELVRTCHHDLEDLIKLRNESLPLLETKPSILDRINIIIENARRGLLEVARLVEKLRPEAHNGSSPLLSRLEWLFIDSREFASQEPLISRQHSSVIAELNFLRQLVLFAPLLQGAQMPGSPPPPPRQPAVAWDNVGLLDEMLGGKKTPHPLSMADPERRDAQHSGTGGAASNSFSGPFPADLPPPYQMSRPASRFGSGPLPSPTPSMTNPLVYNAATPHVVAPRKSTMFDAGGVAMLFGDIKAPPTQETVPMHQPPPQKPPGFLFQDLGTPQPRSLSNVPPTLPHASTFPSLAAGTFYLGGHSSSTSSLPLMKPLSTIPQELIHRQDNYNPLVRSPPPPPPPKPQPQSQPLTVPIPRPVSAMSSMSTSHHDWQWAMEPTQLMRNTRNVNTNAGPSPLPAPGTHTPSRHRDAVEALPSFPPIPFHEAATLTAKKTPSPENIQTYATVRQHWQPDYLAQAYKGHQDSTKRGPERDGAEVYELPAAPHPPSPVELP